MVKQKKKIIKGTWHNVGSIESWLSDMALEGLLVSDIDKTRAVFEQGDRTKVEYRIKYLPFEIREGETSITRTNLIGLFGNYGWQEVCSFEDVYVFRSIDDENYKELPIFDFETVHFKRTINKEILAKLGLGAMGAFNLYSYFSYDFPSRILQKGGLFYFLVAFYSFLVPIILMCKLFISKRKAKQEINHHDNWKAISRKQIIQAVLVFTIAVAILISNFFIYTPEERMPLDDSYTAVIRLSDIEQHDKNLAFDNNYIMHSSSFLAPEYYYLCEGANRSSDWLQASQPYIVVKYYELRFEIFSQSLIKELAYGRYEYDQLNEIESDFFDSASGFSSEDYKELYLSKGNIVVSVDYRGNKTVDEVLEIVEEKLAQQYKAHNRYIRKTTADSCGFSFAFSAENFMLGWLFC